MLAARRAKPQTVALLAPLTGPAAAIGQSLQRAATLAQPGRPRNGELIVLDTGGTPEGASAAATQAIKRDARIILGPLFAAEVRPVLAAVAGRAPVLSFSNDTSLTHSGAFLLGVTAAQLTTAILRYARRRGVRRIALVGSGGAWTAQAFEVARRVAGELGLTLVAAPTATPAALTAALGRTDPPDAVFAPEADALPAIARALRGGTVQLLGIAAAPDPAPATLAAFEGAWLAAPDPAGFADFARRYQAGSGAPAGTIAALAYDASAIADAVLAAGAASRDALLVPAGFPGVSGRVRFRADGSCVRELAILVAGPGGYAAAERGVAG